MPVPVVVNAATILVSRGPSEIFSEVVHQNLLLPRVLSILLGMAMGNIDLVDISKF
jgi:hypothetical protein